MEAKNEQPKVETVAIDNPGESPIYINGAAVMPGETRVFNKRDVPQYLQPEQADTASAEKKDEDGDDNPLVAMLNGTVPNIVDALPDLTVEALAELAALEQAGKDRKGVLEAITAEQLKRVAG